MKPLPLSLISFENILRTTGSAEGGAAFSMDVVHHLRRQFKMVESK
ncbi:MAG: hypothetical protein K9K79_03795 [Desulfohalobiaceae bacterium]|nr:hypothetical protein [Desulfohalobiaceae bacterium]